MSCIPTASLAEPRAGRTLLVVDDEILVRSVVADFLRGAGFRVIEAHDAAEAVSVLASGAAVDLVFSDVEMPGKMNGIALAGWIRRRHPEIPVLLTSGKPAAASRPGASPLAFLPKPYGFDELADRIRELIAQASTGEG